MISGLTVDELDYQHAVYAGSFDPITLGHTAIVERAAKLYDRITVGIARNINKSPLFSVENRVEMAQSTLAHLDNVEVKEFEGLLVDNARLIGAGIILRGLRMLTDFELEFQLALANRDLNSDIETVFLMTNQAHVFVSSSLVKEIAANHGAYERYVSASVREMLEEKFPGKSWCEEDDEVTG
jgi:pantetheine-phosphate adenylyltransferase